MTTIESRDRRPEDAGQPMQLLWAPPSYAKFVAGDDIRFRFLLNHRSWATGLLWSAFEHPGAPARSGITWSCSTPVKDEVWWYLSQASAEGVDAADAYDAVVADTPGAQWSDEFKGSGVELDGARRWLQRFSSSTSWAGLAVVPGRTMDQHIDGTFRVLVAYSKGDVQGLHAHRRGSLLWREDGRWWRVPREDVTLRWDQLVPVVPTFTLVFDQLDLEALTPSVLSSFTTR